MRAVHSCRPCIAANAGSFLSRVHWSHQVFFNGVDMDVCVWWRGGGGGGGEGLGESVGGPILITYQFQ